MKDQILKAMNWRYAVKAYDKDKKVSAEDLNTILEAGRLAPSSLGLEPTKLLVIENAELRERIKGAAWGQPQVTDATHLVVVANRTDVRENLGRELLERTSKASGRPIEELGALKAMLDGSMAASTDEQLVAMAKNQAFITLGVMIETAALLNVDASSMGGFNPAQVDEILGLKEKHLASAVLFAVGYRSADDAQALRPKVRREPQDVIEYVK